MNTAFQESPPSTFETQDLQLATALFALGASLIHINRVDPARCGFVFNDKPNLRATVDAYWHKELCIEPQTLLASLKAIKSRLYNEKL